MDILVLHGLLLIHGTQMHLHLMCGLSDHVQHDGMCLVMVNGKLYMIQLMHEEMEVIFENFFKCLLLVSVITAILLFTMWGPPVTIGPLLLTMPITPTASTSIRRISTLSSTTTVRTVSLFVALRIPQLL